MPRHAQGGRGISIGAPALSAQKNYAERRADDGGDNHAGDAQHPVQKPANFGVKAGYLSVKV